MDSCGQQQQQQSTGNARIWQRCLCGKLCDTEKGLLAHLDEAHGMAAQGSDSKLKTFVCCVCGVACKTYTALYQHGKKEGGECLVRMNESVIASIRNRIDSPIGAAAVTAPPPPPSDEVNSFHQKGGNFYASSFGNYDDGPEITYSYSGDAQERKSGGRGARKNPNPLQTDGYRITLGLYRGGRAISDAVASGTGTTKQKGASPGNVVSAAATAAEALGRGCLLPKMGATGALSRCAAELDLADKHGGPGSLSERYYDAMSYFWVRLTEDTGEEHVVRVLVANYRSQCLERRQAEYDALVTRFSAEYRRKKELERDIQRGKRFIDKRIESLERRRKMYHIRMRALYLTGRRDNKGRKTLLESTTGGAMTRTDEVYLREMKRMLAADPGTMWGTSTDEIERYAKAFEWEIRTGAVCRKTFRREYERPEFLPHYNRRTRTPFGGGGGGGEEATVVKKEKGAIAAAAAKEGGLDGCGLTWEELSSDAYRRMPPEHQRHYLIATMRSEYGGFWPGDPRLAAVLHMAAPPENPCEVLGASLASFVTDFFDPVAEAAGSVSGGARAASRVYRKLLATARDYYDKEVSRWDEAIPFEGTVLHWCTGGAIRGSARDADISRHVRFMPFRCGGGGSDRDAWAEQVLRAEHMFAIVSGWDARHAGGLRVEIASDVEYLRLMRWLPAADAVAAERSDTPAIRSAYVNTCITEAFKRRMARLKNYNHADHVTGRAPPSDEMLAWFRLVCASGGGTREQACFDLRSDIVAPTLNAEWDEVYLFYNELYRAMDACRELDIETLREHYAAQARKTSEAYAHSLSEAAAQRRKSRAENIIKAEALTASS